jgi:hypothetical protein
VWNAIRSAGVSIAERSQARVTSGARLNWKYISGGSDNRCWEVVGRIHFATEYLGKKKATRKRVLYV